MIGLPLNYDSRARSSTARFLALFLALSVFSHGLFYAQGWLIFGLAISGYGLLTSLPRRFQAEKVMDFPLGSNDLLLFSMMSYSLLGLLHPVKAEVAMYEALHWGIFWLVYRMGMSISSDEKAQMKLFSYLQWLACFIALLGWLPGLNHSSVRLSSVFGYPNALAAFLAAVLLLKPQWKSVQIVLVTSLLATGSRAGVGLFVVIFLAQQIILGAASGNIRLLSPLRQRGRRGSRLFSTENSRKVLWSLFLGIFGLVVIVIYNKGAWENLTTWSLSSPSYQERLAYFKDGLKLAWNVWGVPQAGGWLAFPTVQHFPYWTADPHSSIIHILLNQGVLGLLSIWIWGLFRLFQAGKTWRKKGTVYQGRADDQEIKRQIPVASALLYLMLHSLVDTDFAFGALGCLFWILMGSLRKAEIPYRLFYTKRIKRDELSHKLTIIMSGLLCIVCGGILLNPVLLKKEQNWNALAVRWREQDLAESLAYLDKSLKWDQTQSVPRQMRAEKLLQRGELELGLAAVEEVLEWQPFNLAAYEWAQSELWDAAEEQGKTRPQAAAKLYQWVERVPARIAERKKLLTSGERMLWRREQQFEPSQHILLLAELARQRQLTQLNLPT